MDGNYYIPIVNLNGKELINGIPSYQGFDITFNINGKQTGVQKSTLNRSEELYFPLNIIQINISPGVEFYNIIMAFEAIGNIAEVILFSNIVSKEDSSLIYDYLLNKWNPLLDSTPEYTLCSYNLTPTELQCYQNNYPDLNGLNSNKLQNNWKTVGCKQKRNNQCPSYQTNAGNYNYAGCFNTIPSDNKGYRSIPKNQGVINSIDDCYSIANTNKDSIFGIQTNSNGQSICWTGTNANIEMNQNYNRNDCKPMGTINTQQVYKVDKPFPPPIPTSPTLSDYNFANSIENFDNRNNNRFLLILILILIIGYLYYFFIIKRK
jgi:hypothetical protein